MTRRPQPSRRGAVLVAAIVCLLITLSIVTTTVTGTITRRGQLATERNARQADLLVVAGRGRAVAQLAADPDYRGERWTPTVDATAGRQAVVEINPQTTGDGAVRVTVVAAFPDGGPKSVRRSRVFLLPQAKPISEE